MRTFNHDRPSRIRLNSEEDGCVGRLRTETWFEINEANRGMKWSFRSTVVAFDSSHPDQRREKDGSPQKYCGKTDERSCKSISRTSCALASRQGLLPHTSSEQTLHLPRTVHRRSLRCARHRVRTHGQGEAIEIRRQIAIFLRASLISIRARLSHSLPNCSHLIAYTCTYGSNCLPITFDSLYGSHLMANIYGSHLMPICSHLHTKKFTLACAPARFAC